MCIVQKLSIFKLIFEFNDSSFDVFVIYRNILINECDQFRIEKGRHHENTTPLTVFHDVKGYHHFRI